MKRETRTIDATGVVLGRLASEIAVLLRGKYRPDFYPYKDMGDIVIVKNADKMKITGNKLEQKKYFRHSEWLGSSKEISLKDVLKKNPGDALRRAVLGMLPKNKLQDKMIKRLKFE
ncbi:MAG: 50S ribosomal protein L13 [bacterium]